MAKRAKVKRQLTIIKADGSVTTKVRYRVPLEALQELVGGPIVGLPYFTSYQGRRCHGWCNEDGQRLNLPRNDAATKLWKDTVGWTPEKQAAGRFGYEPEVRGTLVIDQFHKD